LVAILAEKLDYIYWAPRAHRPDLPKLATGSGGRQDGKPSWIALVRNEPGYGSRTVADDDGLTLSDLGKIRA